MIIPRWLVAALLVMIAATGAAAKGAETALHTELVFSEPAKGDTLTERPERIFLLFSGPVSASLARITLGSGSGDMTLRPQADPEDENVVLAALPALNPGEYHVRWRTISIDGHIVSGEFTFVIALPSTTMESTAAPDVSRAPPMRREWKAVGPLSSPSYVESESASCWRSRVQPPSWPGLSQAQESVPGA